jgi:hypothetical protein
MSICCPNCGFYNTTTTSVGAQASSSRPFASLRQALVLLPIGCVFGFGGIAALAGNGFSASNFFLACFGIGVSSLSVWMLVRFFQPPKVRAVKCSRCGYEGKPKDQPSRQG